MERTAGDTGALGEAIVFLDYFKDLPDQRQRGKVLYPLDEVLLQLSFLITCSLQHRELMAQDNKFQQEVKALADVIFP